MVGNHVGDVAACGLQEGGAFRIEKAQSQRLSNKSGWIEPCAADHFPFSISFSLVTFALRRTDFDRSAAPRQRNGNILDEYYEPSERRKAERPDASSQMQVAIIIIAFRFLRLALGVSLSSV